MNKLNLEAEIKSCGRLGKVIDGRIKNLHSTIPRHFHSSAAMEDSLHPSNPIVSTQAAR